MPARLRSISSLRRKAIRSVSRPGLRHQAHPPPIAANESVSGQMVGVAALNFGFDRHPTHADGYKSAGEFVEVVTKVWENWEVDALIASRGRRSAKLVVVGNRVHALG